jgi:hypothetical protein
VAAAESEGTCAAGGLQQPCRLCFEGHCLTAAYLPGSAVGLSKARRSGQVRLWAAFLELGAVNREVVARLGRAGSQRRHFDLIDRRKKLKCCMDPAVCYAPLRRLRRIGGLPEAPQACGMGCKHCMCVIRTGQRLSILHRCSRTCICHRHHHGGSGQRGVDGCPQTNRKALTCYRVHSPSPLCPGCSQAASLIRMDGYGYGLTVDSR